MVTREQQYHYLINLLRSMSSDVNQRILNVCAFVYKMKSISEKNLLAILSACDINLNKNNSHNIIHFFYYNDIFDIIDENQGFVSTLKKMEPKKYYTEANVDFAKREVERIGRANIE